MTPEEIEKHLAEIIVKAKTKLPAAEARALAPVIVDALRLRGIAVADEGDMIGAADDHLKVLKTIRRRCQEMVDDDDCSGRDMAALTRRLQDVSKEVATIEQRYRGEAKARGTGNNGANTSSSAKSASKPLNI